MNTPPNKLIDQTFPHEVAVSKVLGALSCHEALRVINPLGVRPFIVPTASLADMRGTADLVVSFDGTFNYGLAIEVKTTAAQGEGAWSIFKRVRAVERNRAQFERLVSSTPRWWYLIMTTDNLTAKTFEEHDRAALDCPAFLVEGKQGDSIPDDISNSMRFGELLNQLGAKAFNAGFHEVARYKREPAQQMLPIDDVPVVTMNEPLRLPPMAKVEPSEATPIKAVEPPAPQASSVSLSTLKRSISLRHLAEPLKLVWDEVGEATVLARVAKNEQLKGILDQLVREHAADEIIFLMKYVPSRWRHRMLKKLPPMCMLLAIATDHHRKAFSTKRSKYNVCNEVLPEARMNCDRDRNSDSYRNILRVVGYEACRELPETNAD